METRTAQDGKTYRQAQDGQWYPYATKQKPIKYNPKDYALKKGEQGATPVEVGLRNIMADVSNSPLAQAQAAGGGAEERLAESRAMGPLDTAGKAFTNRMHKFGAGAKELGNISGEFVSAMNNIALPEAYMSGVNKLTGGGYDAMKYNRQNQDLALKEREFDRLNKEFNQAKGIPGFLGDAAGYGAAELATGPISNKLVGGAMNMLSKWINTAGKAAATGGKQAASALEHSRTQAIRNIGTGAKKKIGEPIGELAERFIGRDPVGDANRIGMLKDIGQGVGIGAATGALDYDLTIGEGALTGGVGSLTGAALTKPLSKKYNSNTKAAQEVIKYMKKKKYYQNPGTDIADDALYEKFSGLTSDSTTSGIMKSYARANQRTNNKLAYSTMGIGADDAVDMTHKTFDEAMQAAGNEFDTLAKGTKGYIPAQTYRNLNKDFEKIIKNPASNKTTIEEVSGVMEYLKQNTTTDIDPMTKRFTKATFDGDMYQEMRTLVKNKVDDAHSKGDRTTAEAIKPALQYLDDSIEEGMNRGGKIDPKQWAAARKKWAMGNIVKDSTDPATMNVDPMKLYNNLLDDPRMMRGSKDPDITKLMMVGKMGNLERLAKKSAGELSAPLMHKGHRNRSIIESLISNPITRSLGPIDEAGIDIFMRGYPAQYGLAGMNRYDGRFKPSTFARPISQAGQLWPRAIEGATGAYDTVTNPTQSIAELRQWWEDKQKETAPK